MKKAVPYLILVFLFAAATWYFFTREPEPVHDLLPPRLPPTASVETQQPEPQLQEPPAYRVPEPVLEPEAAQEPLPLLNESDTELTQALTPVVGRDSLSEYLQKDQLISRVVATIDSLTSRQVPAQINPLKPADARFIVDTEGENVVLSARNFARYDGYVAVIQATDSRALIEIFQHYSPLVQQAWEENGGEGRFNDRLIEVIDDLLETPDVPGPVHLTKPEAVYLFVDPELEAMTAGQKVLVRMGSVNAEIVKEKLTEIKAELNR